MAVDLAQVAPHALGAGTQMAAPSLCTTVPRDDGEGLDGRRSRCRQGNIMRFEKMELRNGGQQMLPSLAINSVSEQMPLERALLDGVLAFSADQHAVTCVVL